MLLLYLIADPVLVAEVVYAIEEGWLLLLALFGVGAVQVECFCLLVTNGVRARIIEGVIVSRKIVVVKGLLLRLGAIGKFVPESF